MSLVVGDPTNGVLVANDTADAGTTVTVECNAQSVSGEAGYHLNLIIDVVSATTSQSLSIAGNVPSRPRDPNGNPDDDSAIYPNIAVTWTDGEVDLEAVCWAQYADQNGQSLPTAADVSPPTAGAQNGRAWIALQCDGAQSTMPDVDCPFTATVRFENCD